ncbi:MAG: saccharopine dehydrogenase NADP-binding domain-containing protein [Calditrichaeota bacterium]|nr:saccharopine dehydrogenase NADP-binding domain-containing protein [Calditrichota bacterium]
MQNILILGAGLVAQPLIDYLRDKNKYQLTIASKEFDKALQNYGSDTISLVQLDLNDDSQLQGLIKKSDLVISLVPYSFHVRVAKHCIESHINMITASYVSDEMKALDQAAKDANILILNEIGLDPGIDHMSAMKMIDRFKKDGGKIIAFESNTGGLPFWDSITTPFKYKFSWSPVGVLMAAKNPAQYMENGEIKNIPNKQLFKISKKLDLGEFGEYEVYPNRDSIKYISLYKLDDVKYMYRGTIRNIGWSDVFSAIIDLDMLNNETVYELSDVSFNDFFCIHTNNEVQPALGLACKLLNLDPLSKVIQKLKWLGLFSSEKINKEKASSFDVLLNRLNKNLTYSEDENDLIIMQHRFDVQFNDVKKRYKSLLIASSDGEIYSIMAKTVSLPAAIAAHLILENKIQLTGVQIPLMPEIYEPVLDELEKFHIKFRESSEIIRD